MAKKLKVMFLGGVTEIGKNMTVIQYGDDIIVVDAGLAFPTDDMPGIDIVIPDIAYLIQNKNKIRGIFITHGHEDHIGALPFVLKDIKAPVYGTKLSLVLIETKLQERQIEDASLFCIKAGATVNAGPFTVEFINTTHSISGCCALSITTPLGVIFHTGDFKVDYTPIKGEPMDFRRVAEIGRKGVLLMLCESTNIEKEGYSMSENKVGESLDNIFMSNTDRRIIIATFSSNIHRIQQIFDLAKKYDRKIAFTGRSMIRVCESAAKIGEINYEKGIIYPLDKINKLEDKNIIILCTGSQGEPMSALHRMAMGEAKSVVIDNNDTVIISASPIPGNERMVSDVINNLYRRGANVIYSALADVHVSGHACREELKLMHRLVNPKFFIPVHGEYRHLKQHKDLAISLGMKEQNIILPEIGNLIEVSKDAMTLKGNIQAGAVLVDGLGVGDVRNVVLKDRRILSEDGMVIIVMGLDPFSGELTSGPEIITRGFIYVKENEDLIEEVKTLVIDTLSGLDKEMLLDLPETRSILRKEISTFLRKKTERRPIILPIILTGN